jgi:propanol-preferring alcohol dehydrogenase
MHMKIGVRKRLDILFSYGGQRRDLEETLDLIAAKILDPVVAEGKLKDFPRKLKELEAGKVRGRISLLFD